jgi:hypothetical protein
MGKGDTDDSSQITDEAKLADCQAQLLQKTMLMRTSADALEKFKVSFMKDCMAA